MDHLRWSLPRAHRLLEVLSAPLERLSSGSNRIKDRTHDVQGKWVELDQHAEAKVHCQNDDALHGMQKGRVLILMPYSGGCTTTALDVCWVDITF